MGDTPVCTIDQNGVHKPSLATCLSYFTDGYQDIYGSDTYLGSDSQDGELMGLAAAALDDANTMCVAAYNAYSPGTAQGVGLSSNVKINGLRRSVPTFSTAPILVVGTVGLTIAAGLIADENSNNWALDPNVEIPLAGQITVTATCQTPGAIEAPVGTINDIQNPTRGWVSAVSTANATPGAPLQTDPQLRTLQAQSTMAPAQSPLEAIVADVLDLPGVARIKGYENTTNSLDSNSIPGHSISIVVDGGDANAVAAAINNAKTGGTGTYGTTTETIVNRFGVPIAVNFFYVSEPPITWGLSIVPKNGFSLNTNALIAQSLSDWTNSLGIDGSIQLSRAYAAAYLQTSIQELVAQLQTDMANNDTAAVAADAAAITAMNLAATTYEVVLGSLTVARDGASLAAADVPIAFNEAPNCSPTGVTVTVV